MKPTYIVTGAAGFLGNNIVRLLQGKGRIKAFVLAGDNIEALENLDCEIVYGNVLDKATMEPLFSDEDGLVYMIHCAGIVDIKSSYNPLVYDVNVTGTKNVAKLCHKHDAKMVYISSVHAMPPVETEDGILPATHFDPDSVPGLYAKVKAAASQAVLDEVKKGLHACLIQPSGLIGPYDFGDTNLTQFVTEVANEKLPACVSAGYSFVDVRDAANAIIEACEHGQDGKSYVVAGPEISMQKIADLVSACNHSRPIHFDGPLGLVDAVTPLTSLYYKWTGQKPLYTAFAVHTLKTPSNFNTDAAREDLNFSARPMKETIEDTVAFLKDTFRIDTDCVIDNGKPIRAIKSSKALPIAAAAVTGLLLLRHLKKN